MRKCLEASSALPLSNTDVKAAADAIPHMVWSADADGAATHFNQATAEYTGLTFHQMLGAGWLRAVHPDDIPSVTVAWSEAVRLREPYAAEYRLRNRHGHYRRVQDRANPVTLSRQDVRWIGTLTDVEDDRQLRDQLTQAELRASRELAVSDALASSAPIASGLIDTEFRLVRINDTLARLNGLSAHRDLGCQVADVVPDLWPVFEPRYRQVLSSGEATTVVETVPHAEGGRPTTWLSTYFPVFLDGQITGVGIVGADITATKQAERFRTVVMNTMAESLYALDAEGRITFLNRSASQMLGWSEDEVRGRRAHELIHYLRPDGSAYPEEHCPLFKVRTDGRSLRVTEDAFIRKDGTPVPVCYSASPLKDDTGAVAGVVVVFRDAAGDSEQRQRIQQELDALAWLGRVRDALEDDRLCLYTQPIMPLTGGPPAKNCWYDSSRLQVRSSHRACSCRWRSVSDSSPTSTGGFSARPSSARRQAGVLRRTSQPGRSRTTTSSRSSIASSSKPAPTPRTSSLRSPRRHLCRISTKGGSLQTASRRSDADSHSMTSAPDTPVSLT